MTEVKERIGRFILANYLPGESLENLHEEAQLRSTGVLDSLATLGLITFVEQEYGIELDAQDLAVERFDSINDIAGLISRKQAR